MACVICRPGNGLDNIVTNEDCVIAALESLRRHFAEYKALDGRRKQEIAAIQDHNIKLRQIVELLQKEKIRYQTNVIATDSYNSDENLSISAQNVVVETPSKLDTAALNCEDVQLLSSPIQTGIQYNVDVIDETEAAYQSRTKKRMRNKSNIFPAFKHKLQYPQNNLHYNEKSETSQWLSKLSSPKDSGSKTTIRKQISLSLRKNNIKQSKLHMESFQQKKYDKKKICGNKSPAPLKSALSWILSGSHNKETSQFEPSVNNNEDKKYEPFNETFFIPSNSSDSIVLVSPKSPEVIILKESSDNFSTAKINLRKVASLPDSNCIKAKRNSYSESMNKIESFAINENFRNMNPTNLIPLSEMNRFKTVNYLNLENFNTKANEIFEKNSENMIHTNSEDSCIIQPIIVKEEPQTPNTSIKKRFKINCPDCEVLFAFDNHNMNDDDIEMHLRNCKHYKHKHAMRLTQTPEGFWNPLISSFSKDDPRNEVFIDNRFKNLK